MRDTPRLMVAIHMSDLELFATQERNANDPWSPGIQKKAPPTQLNGGEMPPPGDVVAPSRHGKQLATSSSNSENRCDIRFGLHPSELFESSKNVGAYREYDHHSSGNIDRGFAFQLENRGSDSLSDFTDDGTVLSSHSSRHTTEKGDSRLVDDD